MSPLSSPPFPFLFRFQRSKPKPQTGASWGPGTLQPGHWEPASHPFPQLKDSGATRVSSLSLPGWSSRGSSQALGGSQSGCREDQHFPVSSNQAGQCLPSVAICKDPKDPCSLLPPPISILTHRQTHTHMHLVRPGICPRPLSSQVKRPHHASVLAQGNPCSLCYPIGLGSSH